jgi:hypothetical protein
LLAYVYFHRAGSEVETLPYEAALRRFHASLASEPPTGFISSTTYRIGNGYADWYLVNNSAALDPLNEAAVDRARSAPHDAVARMSAEGAGKLMTLRSGNARVEPGFEIRFSKPGGLGYSELYKRLKPWTGLAEVSLWRRMMVLGPAPEFCLVTPSELDLPEQMRPEILRREPI